MVNRPHGEFVQDFLDYRDIDSKVWASLLTCRLKIPGDTIDIASLYNTLQVAGGQPSSL